jgi:hypothetical protein
MAAMAGQAEHQKVSKRTSFAGAIAPAKGQDAPYFLCRAILLRFRRAGHRRHHAHERVDLLGPLGAEILIGAGPQAHVVADVVLLGEEVPDAALHLDRDDLVLPVLLTERRLLLAGGRVVAGEVRLRIDRELAGACRRGGWRRDERDRPRRRRRIRPGAVLHALEGAAAILEVHRLPIEVAAVGRHARAVGTADIDVGIRPEVAGADPHRRDRREGNEDLPSPADPDPLWPLLPDRRDAVGELDGGERRRLVAQLRPFGRTVLEGQVRARIRVRQAIGMARARVGGRDLMEALLRVDELVRVLPGADVVEALLGVGELVVVLPVAGIVKALLGMGELGGVRARVCRRLLHGRRRVTAREREAGDAGHRAQDFPCRHYQRPSGLRPRDETRVRRNLIGAPIRIPAQE